MRNEKKEIRMKETMEHEKKYMMRSWAINYAKMVQEVLYSGNKEKAIWKTKSEMKRRVVKLKAGIKTWDTEDGSAWEQKLRSETHSVRSMMVEQESGKSWPPIPKRRLAKKPRKL